MQEDIPTSFSSIGPSHDFPIIILTSGGAEESPMDHSHESVVREFHIFQGNHDVFVKATRFRY